MSSHSLLVNELQTKFQSLENKLSKENGGQITAHFASTCHKLQKSIDDLPLNIDQLIPGKSNVNIQMEIDNTSESINVPPQSRSCASAASPSNSALSIIDELADQEKKERMLLYI